MIWGLIKAFGGNLISGFLENIKAKQDLKKAIELAKIERVNRLDTADIEWEQLMAQGSQNSWKDEWLTICVTMLVFGIPTFSWLAAVWDCKSSALEMLPQLYVAIDQVPDWLKVANGIVFAGSFGIKPAVQWMVGKNLQK